MPRTVNGIGWEIQELDYEHLTKGWVRCTILLINEFNSKEEAENALSKLVGWAANEYRVYERIL